MKIRYWVGIIATSIFLLVSVIPVASQEDSIFPEDVFPDRRRPISLFSHDGHMEYDSIEDCYVCHHVYEDGKLIEGESSDGTACGECHELNPSGNPVDRLSAYHKRCKGCHEKQRSGPITCGECHKR
jgi:hypothetical protein